MKRIMNYLILPCLLFMTIGISSCGDDDDCNVGALSEVIVGNWSLNALGMNTGSVEFLSDGTLVDPDDVLIGGEIGGVVLDQKSYTTTGNSDLNLRAESGSTFIESSYEVTGIECDKISLLIIGIEATLDRE